jgi:RHS repeat-associated protein
MDSCAKAIVRAGHLLCRLSENIGVRLSILTLSGDPSPYTTAGNIGVRLSILTWNIGVRLSILTLSGDPSPYTTATYDANGNVLTQTDASGNTTTFEYDNLGRLKTATQPETDQHDAPVTTYVYDAAGNMISMPKPGEETTRLFATYDAWNRLKKVYVDTDDDGNFEPSDAPGGGDDALLATYEFDGLNRRIEKTTTAAAPGGARQVDYYFNENWQVLEDRTVVGTNVAVNQYIWDLSYIDSPLVNLAYAYDYAGNRLYRQDLKAGSGEKLDELYHYDGMYQLTDVKRGVLDLNSSSDPDDWDIDDQQFAQDWDLDATGNWTAVTTNDDEQTREHNAANEITGIDSSGANVDYDAAGNMIVTPKPGASGHFHLQYDAWNRLTKVFDADGETLVAEYQYDGLNRRIVKLTYDEGDLSEIRHFYQSAQNQVLEERLANVETGEIAATANRQNVWGVRYVDDLVLRDDDSDNDGDPADGSLGKANSGLDRRLYALQDANWNVVAVVGYQTETWQVLERYTYTAYGKCEIRTDAFVQKTPNASDYDWTSLYTTREFDPETGFYYYRWRYYDADMGRLIGRDPIGYSGGINLYEYVGDNPTNATDPSGLRNPAKQFEYVPNAVKWMYLKIGESDAADNLGWYASTVQGGFQANPNQFKDDHGCPLCTSLGVVQIAKYGWSIEVGTLPFIGIIPISRSRDWFVDGGFPYKKKSIDPSRVDYMSFGTAMGEQLVYTDSPNRATARFVRSYDQSTEMHLMCVEGKEKGAVYGGADWSHSFHGYGTAPRRLSRRNTPTQQFKDLVKPLL